jgi:putative alpha-1,2-mannosidase
MKSLTKFQSLILFLSLTSIYTVQSQSKISFTKYVNTFIGTALLTDPKILGYELPQGWRSWAGLTFPGSSLPNAMVQLSPITEFGSGAGYESCIHSTSFIKRSLGKFLLLL